MRYVTASPGVGKTHLSVALAETAIHVWPKIWSERIAKLGWIAGCVSISRRSSGNR